MSEEFSYSANDMFIDERLGYPRAYEKICRRGEVGRYIIQETESLKNPDLHLMFPVINPRANPTSDPRIFLDSLWKELDHLGDAGFDPAVFRVDPYGNVLYYYADSASPLAWDIHHWFPLSRGGLTVPNNLKLLQQQACKEKHNKLEFMVAKWDLQMGISVSQFLSIFESSNSDFRRRGLSFLFKEGENEELNNTVTVASLCYPRCHPQTRLKSSLPPTAIVRSLRGLQANALAVRSLDHSQQTRPPSPTISARKIRVKSSTMKENESPNLAPNPYQTIVAARSSLKIREESQRLKAEIKKLEGEVNEMRRQNDEEKLTIEELECKLIHHRKGAEKCRRLAEEQGSYKNTLDKMIRDAMHQSVVYKEQARLNHAATIMLKARLEAQNAICDESEKELHRKSKKRDELEMQMRSELEQVRKKSRLYNHNPPRELVDGVEDEHIATDREML